MRMALGIEYEGSSYHGWQSQPGLPSIQDHLQTALAAVAAHPVQVNAAGRTDAGVHATGQVIHFDTTADRDAWSWVRGGNSHLPANIRILWAQAVPDEFHARFAAIARSYDYWLLNDPVSPGVMEGRVGWFHAPLDEALLQSAADHLLGKHDFTTFRSAECQAKTPVKTLQQAKVSRHGPFLRFQFKADAFLHHMVRNIVGSLIYVGCGRKSESWMAEILAARDRALAAPTFAPDGLYLSCVHYDERYPLPAARPRMPWMIE
jgi:tRNA pseudouridine38-40 synthase